MIIRILSLTLMMTAFLCLPTNAQQQAPSAFIHVVRPGETLASIAQRYYGDARRETVLVAENGLTTRGGAPIVVGLRLVIPWVSYHRVQRGETWGRIALMHYGDARRISALMDANPQIQGNQPDEGAELLVAYPLRHVARQRETMRSIARLYYGDPGEALRLMRFNAIRRRRVNRGQIVLVPLADLLLSEEGQQAVERVTGNAVEGGEIRELQTRINELLPGLREQVQEGRYAEAIALGNRLLGAGELTGNQILTVHRELAVAFVALGRTDLAEEAFREALERQPDMQLDSRRVSPTVLETFEAAQRRRAIHTGLARPNGESREEELPSER